MTQRPRFHFDPRRSGGIPSPESVRVRLADSLATAMQGIALSAVRRAGLAIGEDAASREAAEEVGRAAGETMDLAVEFGFDPLSHPEVGPLLVAACAASVTCRMRRHGGDDAPYVDDAVLEAQAARMRLLARRGIQAMAVEALARGAMADGSDVDLARLVGDEVDAPMLALLGL